MTFNAHYLKNNNLGSAWAFSHMTFNVQQNILKRDFLISVT